MVASTPATLSHDAFVAALERRYDFQSARTVAAELLTAAGLERAAAYDAEAVGQLRAGVSAAVTRGQRVLHALVVPTVADAALPVETAPAPAAPKKKA